MGEYDCRFYFFPLIFQLLIICTECCERGRKAWNAKKLVSMWRIIEILFESGPQLILQLYIMSLPSEDTSEDQDTDVSMLSGINLTLTNKSELTSVAPSTNFTETYERESNIKGLVTFALQILAVVTALISISWGAVSFKKEHEQDDHGVIEMNFWGATDYICDMTWNMLCISSRVITLALLASWEIAIFAGIVGGQFLLVSFIYCLLQGCFNMQENYGHGPYGYGPKKTKSSTKYAYEIFSLIISSIYNISLTCEQSLRFYMIYVCYWVMIMTEDTVLISIWYIQSSGEGLWYHDPAIAYVITAYIISFFIKTYQTYQRKNKDKEYINVGKPLRKWIC